LRYGEFYGIKQRDFRLEGLTVMATARTAMHYLVMAAFICATSQSALAQTTVKPATTSAAKATIVASSKPAPVASKPAPKPPAPKPPKPAPTPVAKTCLDVYNGVGVKTAILVSASKTPAPTLSSTDLKNKNIQDALRATLLKVALVALSKVPPGKACDALIAKIDAKFSRS
jgi:hypothetical protein